MNYEEIIQLVPKYIKEFENILKNNPYQKRGIFNSELLLICALIKEQGIKNIIESGRARGHSTKVLCDFFDDTQYKIQSIDFDKDSQDVKYAEKQLKQYDNLHLLYGDSNRLIPNLLHEDSAIIIDGPKGEDAIVLAIKLLKNKHAKMIFIHDLHKTTFERNIFDMLFINTFASDNLKYVTLTQDLDKECWEILKESGQAPYVRNNKENKSYASTICVIFNENTLNSDVVSNYLNYYEQKSRITLAKYLSTVWGSNSFAIKTLRRIRHLLSKSK